ncbi:MAG: TrgA family protein [Paracoccaceae bacterium]|nr:TrgA family protein [Paracoccaceae bacterium]
MPTAAKLFAAFAFTLVGFFTAEVLKPSFPEGFGFGSFSVACGALGLLAGWRVMGPSAAAGTVRAASTGVKTSFVLTMWALTAFSIRQMIIESMRSRYDGVFDAIYGIFEIMLEYAQLLLSSIPALGVLVIGGMLGGMFSSWAAVRWR